MYAILIKDSRTNNYRFFTQKKEENSEPIQIPCLSTGRDNVVVFSTSSLSELETKCIELLNNYKATDIVPINVLNYSTDLVWGITEDSEDNDVFEREDMDFSDFFEDEDLNDEDSNIDEDSNEEIDNEYTETD